MSNEEDTAIIKKDENEEPVSNRKRNAEEMTPITQDGDMPQKQFYRQRAHCNPLSHNQSFTYPRKPDLMDWGIHFPETGHQPTVLDIGCGFGGLTMALATLLPDEVILGMEIRAKVTEYVRLRILAHRKEHPGQYQNASVMRTNSMKFLPHYFQKASLSKLFFCFPDPHFKKKNHSRRIVSETLLSEYAFLLKPGGRLYCITDVKDLHDWHIAKCDAHPMFRKLSTGGASDNLDPCIKAMQEETEEGKKVSRNKGSKYYGVYERIETENVPRLSAANFFSCGNASTSN